MRLEMHVKDEILNIIAPNRMKQTMSIYLPPKKKTKNKFEQEILFSNTDTPMVKSYRQGRP